MPWGNYALEPQLLNLCPKAQKLQLLSLCCTWSPCSLEAMLHNKRSLHITTREWPPFASTREKPAEQWRPSTAINKEILFWCRSNHGFALLNFAVCYENTFLNKCGYVIHHHFHAHFLLYGFFFLFLLMTYYLLFILYLFRLGKSVQFSHSVVSLCDPMDCSMAGFLVHHQLLELTPTHVHRVSDAIQPSHPLSSPSLPAFNLS